METIPQACVLSNINLTGHDHRNGNWLAELFVRELSLKNCTTAPSTSGVHQRIHHRVAKVTAGKKSGFFS